MTRAWVKFPSIGLVVAGAAWIMAFCAEAAPGATSPYLPASEQDVGKLLSDRSKFVQDIYQPPAPEAAKIVEALRELDTTQVRYQRETALTLQRLQLALSMCANDPKKTALERSVLTKKFEEQYHRMLAKAPLSLRNVVRIAETTLSTELVNSGRSRLEKTFAETLQISGQSLDIERIDAIAFGPVVPYEQPEIKLPARPVPSPPPPPPTTPSPPRVEAKQTAPAAQPPTRQQTAPLPRPQQIQPAPPPPPPPSLAAPTAQVPPGQPLPAAPPAAEWAGYFEKAATRFEFTPDQKQQAEEIANQCTARAAKLRDTIGPALRDAEKLADGAEKNKKLRDVNAPLDRMYDQMVRRIDSIASLEQRNRAAARAKETGKDAAEPPK